MKKYPLPLFALLIISVFLIFGITRIAINSLTPTGKVTLSTKVNIYEALPANCSFTIPSGTNQISFFCIPNGINAEEVLENLSYEIIWTYKSSESDPWKIKNPSLPSWVVQDLNLMSRTEGYYIKTSVDQNYFYSGSKRVPNTINLVSGWNYVGYPTNESKIIPAIFATISGNYDEVTSYNNTDALYYTHIPPSSGNLKLTEPYRTYWIYMNANDEWVIS